MLTPEIVDIAFTIFVIVIVLMFYLSSIFDDKFSNIKKCKNCGKRKLSASSGIGQVDWEVYCTECGNSTEPHITLQDAYDDWQRIN